MEGGKGVGLISSLTLWQFLKQENVAWLVGSAKHQLRLGSAVPKG